MKRRWCLRGSVASRCGATPTAMANMSAVTKRYGACHEAFIIVPLVGAFFIDIANVIIIQQLLGWIGWCRCARYHQYRRAN